MICCCGCKLKSIADRILADDRYSIDGQLSRKIGILDPGIDDYRNELLWSPENPNLIERACCWNFATGRGM